MEINPQTINPEYALPTFTPCGPWISSYDEFNPWQVVWNQISFSPDPYQQMFNFQDNRYGPGLQRRTYILDPNKSYNLTIQQSEEYAYFTYGGFYDDVTGVYVPLQYVGTTLNGVSGSDLGATGWLDYVRDYPNGLYNNDSKYRMKIKRDVPPGTEIIMSVFDGQETINYHTRIETPTFAIENITDEDTLLHYYSREIDFRLNFQQSSGSCQLDGYGGSYPLGIKFNVEIVQGQEYGNLYYPGTVADPEQSGTSITNIEDEYGIGIANYTIKYKADGVQPDSLNPGIVTIRCSSNDIDIAPVEVSFPVKYNEDPPDEGGYIIVRLDKQSYEPGDTATTNCKWLTAYNELMDFPAEQSFNVVITGGSEFGMLLDPNTGTIADNLQGVSNGFKVITATSTPYDSVVIRLKVNTTVEVNNSSRMITNQNPKSEIKENNVADIDENTQTITPDIFVIGGEEIVGFGDLIVKKDGDWCDSLIICNSTEYLPNIILNQVPNGYNGFDICTPNVGQIEGVNTFWTDTLYTFDLSLCNNDLRQKLWFNINDNHTLKVNYSLAICEEHVPESCQFIDDWTGLADTLDCDELDNILTAASGYGSHATPCYYFKNVIYAHEQEHLNDYQNTLDQAKDDFFNRIDLLFVQCIDFENENSAEIFLKNILEKEFRDFRERSRIAFIDFCKQYINQQGGYEQVVQDRTSVKEAINDQIKSINNAFECSIKPLYY